MKALQKLSCIVAAAAALFSCTKTIPVEEKEPEPIKITETFMTLPGQGQVLSSAIWLDPADGHYKSSAFDFGSTLTHPTNYVTGQAGVGIHSITGRNGDLISVDISGDRFTAYLVSIPGGNLPPTPFSSFVSKTVERVAGFQVDVSQMLTVLGPHWLDSAIGPIVHLTDLGYFSLDTLRLKSKNGKLKVPLVSSNITGTLFSANSDGIIIYKGRILMDANAPSGMAIYPYDVTPVYDPNDTTPFIFGTYYPQNGTLGSISSISFLSTQADATRGYGNIIALYVNFQGTPAVYTGTFRSEPPTGPYQMARIFVTFHGTLPDGTEVHLDDVEVTPGV
jgi:hypothetical protein